MMRIARICLLFVITCTPSICTIQSGQPNGGSTIYLVLASPGNAISSVLKYLFVSVRPHGDSNLYEAKGSFAKWKMNHAEYKLLQYIKNQTEISEKAGEFRVQGCRWHAMSLIRETKRLHAFANQRLPRYLSTTKNLNSTDVDAVLKSLKQVTNYVIDFNMKGLYAIEKDLFFPWIRYHLGSKQSSIMQSDIRNSFNIVMDRIEVDKKSMGVLGTEIIKTVQLVDARIPTARDESASDSVVTTLVTNASKEVSVKAARVIALAESILQKQEKFLIPLIKLHIPEQEQASFNNRVLRKLGVLNSRLHLVGMYEAIYGHDVKQNMDHEKKLFRESIPSVPRLMIPRWKRLLYDPQVAAFKQYAV